MTEKQEIARRRNITKWRLKGIVLTGTNLELSPLEREKLMEADKILASVLRNFNQTSKIVYKLKVKIRCRFCSKPAKWHIERTNNSICNDVDLCNKCKDEYIKDGNVNILINTITKLETNLL